MATNSDWLAFPKAFAADGCTQQPICACASWRILESLRGTCKCKTISPYWPCFGNLIRGCKTLVHLTRSNSSQHRSFRSYQDRAAINTIQLAYGHRNPSGQFLLNSSRKETLWHRQPVWEVRSGKRGSAPILCSTL